MTKNLPKWDLSALYKNRKDPAINKDIERCIRDAKRFKKTFESQLATLSADQLAEAIAHYETLEDQIGRLSSYAYLQYSEEISNNDYARLYQNISESINDISTILLFFTLQLNEISDKTLQTLYKNSSKLKHYQPWLRDVRAFKPYQLDSNLESLMHERAVTARHSWHRLFEETLADMRITIDKKSLTLTEALDHLSSPTSAMRKKAAKAIGKSFQAQSKIFTLMTNVLAKDKSIEDKWRQFKTPISSRNLSNLIEDDVTEALISTVKTNYKNLSHRYYKLKAKWLKKDTLHYSDRNAPLPGSDERYIPWQEAQSIVLEAYEEFSPQMADIGTRFFDEHWIDAPPTKGKDSGAFSHPTVPSAHPYILLNYQGKTRDVMTLAHELGHGVHQVLSASQGALMADTPLTLAETASVFGEQLVFQKILSNQTSEKQRRLIIANKVEDMLNTVVRQVAFCEFERHIHNRRKEGELSTDQIGDIWINVQKESLGPAITYDAEYRYYWAYIPHFIHTPFYVYSYAFGDCLVNSLYAAYRAKPTGFEEKYLTMLKAGGTLRHKELLKPFGLNASKPDFWQSGLDVISDYIDQL